MSQHSDKQQAQLVHSVLNAFTAATRTTQIRLFHGLVPAVVELRDAREQLDVVISSGWVRTKRTTEAVIHVHGIRALIDHALQVIDTRSSELGYPLDQQIANYLETRASLTSLADMGTALADLSDADWDAWASALTDERGDAAA